MPYFEFVMLIDDWIDEIEEQKKEDERRRAEADKERRLMESSQRSQQNLPKMPDNFMPKM